VYPPGCEIDRNEEGSTIRCSGQEGPDPAPNLSGVATIDAIVVSDSQVPRGLTPLRPGGQVGIRREHSDDAPERRWVAAGAEGTREPVTHIPKE